MATLNNTARTVSEPSPNSIVPGRGKGAGGVTFTPINEYIGMAIQPIYGWHTNSIFYTYTPPQLKPFFRMVQNWERWATGIVPEFHNITNGVVPTMLGKTIVDKVSSLIYGGGITFAVDGESADGGKNEALDYASNWAKECGFKAVLQDGIRGAAMLGTSILKLNVSNDRAKKTWVEAFPLSRCRPDFDARGNLVRCRFYIRPYWRTERDANEDNAYLLVEDRAWETVDGKTVPTVTFRVTTTGAMVNQFDFGSGCLDWRQLPNWLREAIHRDYGGMRIGERERLPFVDIGAYALKYTPSVSRMPHLRFGDSCLEGIIQYLCQYDILSAVTSTEMYVSRARVIAARQMANRAAGSVNFNAGIDDFMFMAYNSADTADKGVTAFQPEIRSESLRGLRNTFLEAIATSVGISPSSFAQYLQDGSQRTAREISAEESATALMIENKRDLLSKPINDLIKTALLYAGLSDDIVIRFSKAGQSNYTLLTDNVTKLHAAGLISTRLAVEQIHPEFDQEQVIAEVERIAKEAEDRQRMQEAMFGGMDFGETSDPLTDGGGGGDV